jgi:hypothetical protein
MKGVREREREKESGQTGPSIRIFQKQQKKKQITKKKKKKKKKERDVINKKVFRVNLCLYRQVNN